KHRGDARHAGPGRLERAELCADQRHRCLHQPASPQGGTAGQTAAHPDTPRHRLLSVRSLMRLSIRWRLTLWNTLALAVVLLGFSGLVYGLLARALYASMDRSLLAEFRELEQD